MYEIRLTTTPTYDRMVGTERGRKSNTICMAYAFKNIFFGAPSGRTTTGHTKTLYFICMCPDCLNVGV